MPKFAKILLVILIVLVVLGLLLAGYLWLKGRKTTPVENINEVIVNQPPVITNTNTAVSVNANININQSQVLDSNALAEQRVKRLAIFFAEKFGTYSSQGDFENFKELYDYMTPRVRSWAQTQVSNKWRLQDPYIGVTTRALRALITQGKVTNSNLRVIVDTQREKRDGNSTNVVYESLRLELIKSNDDWLVDGAYWE